MCNLTHRRLSLFGRKVTNRWHISTRVLNLSLIASCLLTNQLVAQTPWQASPATPATLTPPEKAKTITGSVVGQRSMATLMGTDSKLVGANVESLPPPPGLKPPAHVSVTTGAPAPKPTGASLGNTGESLVPDSFDISGRLGVSGSAPQTQMNSSVLNPVLAKRNGFDGLPLPATPQTAVGGTAGQVPVNLPAYPTANITLPSPPAGTPSTDRIDSTMPPSATNPTPAVNATRASLVGFTRDAEISGNPSAEPTTNASENELFDAGKLIAVVGTDHILAGDMSVFVEPIIEKNRDRIPSKADEDRLRIQLTRQVLTQYVEVKALYQEFFRDMAGTAPPKEIEDMKKQIVTRASKIFYEKQVPNLLEKYEVVSLADLEVKLRENSMSLNTLRTQFIEQVLSGELERKYVPNEFEITRDELLRYYQEHRADFEVQARVRWRQLTIRFDRHDNNKQVVETLIKNLGNQVYLGGKPFEAVAKQSSEGYTAEEGGVYDWTTQGGLKSVKLDQAIFSLEPRKLSQVIEDEIGMHIIEVLEREDGHTKDFALAQKEIRKKLSDERRQTEAEKFRAKVLDRTPVWTLWPEDLKGKVKHVRPLSDALGGVVR